MKKYLTIGIADYRWYALQERLLRERHRVVLLLPDASAVAGASGEALNVTPARHDRLSAVGNLSELIAAQPDLVIAGSNHPTAYEICDAAGIPTIGHSAAARLLENDRDYGRRVTARVCPGLRIPESHTFNTPLPPKSSC